VPQRKADTSADNRSEAEQQTNWTRLTEGAPLFRDVCAWWWLAGGSNLCWFFSEMLKMTALAAL